MKVNIEKLLELKEELRVINSVDLDSIEFYKDGEKVDIPKENIEDWAFVGLTNVDFITSQSYLRNPKDNPLDNEDKASW